MLRSLFLFLLISGQAAAQTSSSVNSGVPAIAVEQRGDNVYLIGRGFHTARDTGSGLKIVCAVSEPPMVTFLFTGGNTYAYTPKEVFANTSFVVLLKGEAQLPDRRRGLARLFTPRERVYGDTVLLHRLQTKELQNVRYEEPATEFRGVRTNKRFLPAKTYTNPTAFEELRTKLNKIAK